MPRHLMKVTESEDGIDVCISAWTLHRSLVHLYGRSAPVSVTTRNQLRRRSNAFRRAPPWGELQPTGIFSNEASAAKLSRAQVG